MLAIKRVVGVAIGENLSKQLLAGDEQWKSGIDIVFATQSWCYQMSTTRVTVAPEKNPQKV